MGSFIGIDLGTTFSAVAKIDETGRPVILHNSDGQNITPSCVEFDSKTVHVGVRALGALRSNIAQDIAAGRFKRNMGTPKTYQLAGQEHTPASLSSFVLAKLLKDAADEIGKISEVVVTVPANFSNEARADTMAAAQKAGLDINHIINEPTAAALCYSFKEELGLDGTYAVYDMGGGTFDISIIRISGYEVKVLTSNGIAQLGGIDFDKDLVGLVARKYQEAAGEEMEDADYTLGDAEEDKKALSGREEINIRVNRKTINVTRKEFEAAISSKVAQSEMQCESALESAGLKPSDIQGVLCAGGSTRIPTIQESIKNIFGQDPLFRSNVDEVVALGAALYAAYKGDKAKLSSTQKSVVDKMSVIECTNMYYGTITLSVDEDGEPKEINRILIEKNTDIPCSVAESFYTVVPGQTQVSCRVTEARSPETNPQRGVIVVKNVTLELPPNRPANKEIKVTFSYDVNQMMRCTFVDVESGAKATIAYHSVERIVVE